MPWAQNNRIYLEVRQHLQREKKPVFLDDLSLDMGKDGATEVLRCSDDQSTKNVTGKAKEIKWQKQCGGRQRKVGMRKGTEEISLEEM